MVLGAEFQSFAASNTKLSLPAIVLADSFHILVVVDLVLLVVWSRFGCCFTSFTRKLSLFIDFHASVNLIWAANWFIEGKLCFSSMSLMCLRSLRVELSMSLSILYVRSRFIWHFLQHALKKKIELHQFILWMFQCVDYLIQCDYGTYKEI